MELNNKLSKEKQFTKYQKPEINQFNFQYEKPTISYSYKEPEKITWNPKTFSWNKE